MISFGLHRHFPRKPWKRGGPRILMKKLCLVLIALTCLPALAAGQVVEEIITRVNNQIITRSEYIRSKDQLRDEIKQQNPPMPTNSTPTVKRTCCAISSISNYFSTKARTWASPATPN